MSNLKEAKKDIQQGGKIIETVQKPMGDDEIKKYLPDAKILTTLDLNKYESLTQIFGKKYVDYFVYLNLDSPNSGHWCGVLKYGDIIEFFDSYGGSPEKVYKYTPEKIREKLGTNNNRLCYFFDNAPEDIIYNDVKYQKDNNQYYDVNTCGRHVCFRILQLLGKGRTLPEYTELMMNAKKHFKGWDWDKIVSHLIKDV